MIAALAIVTGVIGLFSLFASSRARTINGFFKGASPSGDAPGVLSLTLSQVTTWIFARSLMNAAILGYFYGFAGVAAYSAYYLSFLTGGWIIASLRFRHGFDSIQSFLLARFGTVGQYCYNFVVGLRLISEIFANLLVIGIVFGPEGSVAYTASIALIAAVALAYSLVGGLHASIRTDVFQMALLLAAISALVWTASSQDTFVLSSILASGGAIDEPGWVLLAVALLQIWSYPMHDPVMMDRGFIADRRTTRLSFYHGVWLSMLCVGAFGLLGIYAGLLRVDGEDVLGTLMRLLGANAMLLVNVALVVSCMSTLDSTLASAGKLGAMDMKCMKPTIRNGRISMVLFLIGGLIMLYLGSKDLFSAVAVSGTASMFLAPVVFFSLWLGRDDVPSWSFLCAFATAIIGASWYFVEQAGYVNVIGPLFGFEHKYSKLLLISVGVMAIACAAFIAGLAASGRRQAFAPAEIPVDG